MTKKPSKEMLTLYSTVKHENRWLSNNQIAEITEVNYNTVKANNRYLLKQGILDAVEMHPEILYKLSENAIKTEYAQKLEQVLAALNAVI